MNLIFLDLETTGLKETADHILELAIVAVELPTFKEVASFSLTVRPPQWPTVARNLHERVAEMHGASGLLAEVMSCGEPLAAVETAAMAFVQTWAPQTLAWHTPLAGANPDFDRRFLRAQMPKLAAKFHYRNFDVRSLTQLQDWVFGQKPTEGPHRALADCRLAIAQTRAFLGLE